MINKLFQILFLFTAGTSTLNAQSAFHADRINFHPFGQQLQGENEKESPLFFHHSFGGIILAIGQSPKMNLHGIQDIGAGIYYAPKLAYRMNGRSSACVGTNLQALLNAETGLVLNFPFTLGINIGCGSNNDDETDFGAFINGGVGTSFFLSVDPDDEDMTRTSGPYIDLGLRVARYELKFSFLRSFRNTNDVFMISAGIGKVF